MVNKSVAMGDMARYIFLEDCRVENVLLGKNVGKKSGWIEPMEGYVLQKNGKKILKTVKLYIKI